MENEEDGDDGERDSGTEQKLPEIFVVKPPTKAIVVSGMPLAFMT